MVIVQGSAALDLASVELRSLPLFTGPLAVSYLATGIAKHDPLLVDRGRAAPWTTW